MPVRCSYQLSHWSSGIAVEDGWYISIDTAQFAGWISLRGVFGYFTMSCKDGGLSEAGNELPSWVWYDVHMMIVLGYVPSRGWSESPWRTHRYGEWCYKLPAYWAAPVSLSAVTICVGRHTLWTNWPIREPRLISRQDVKALYDHSWSTTVQCLMSRGPVTRLFSSYCCTVCSKD